MTAEQSPDGIEPIRAWRVWRESRTDDGRLELHSVTGAGGDTLWPPATTLQATCPHAAHEAPQAGCSCGIYAHRSLRAALDQARSGAGLIVGEVELWGRVIEHERGFRAQFARPAAVFVPVPAPGRPSDAVAAIARRSALVGYGRGAGLIHSETGLGLSLAEFRTVFVPGPSLPTRAGAAVRTVLLGAAVPAIYISSLVGFFVSVLVGVCVQALLVDRVATAVVAAAGLVGVAVGLLIVGGCVVAARRWDLRGRRVDGP